EQVEDPGEKASLENHYMIQGVPMPIAYYDIHAAHLSHHRLPQDQPMLAQHMPTWPTIEKHCQLHMNAMQAQAEAQMGQLGPGPPGPGAAPSPAPGQASPPRQPGPVTPSRGMP